jgi:hypothetical protein
MPSEEQQESDFEGDNGDNRDDGSGEDKKKNTSYDSHWKEIIKIFFFPALERLLPELARRVDPTREVIFLDKELAQITVSIDGPKQHVDVLAQVPMKRGKDLWLVFHVEVQGAKGGNLPERMFFYNASLRLGYLKKKGHITDVVSFAILTAKRPKSEPEQYERKSYRNHLRYEYPVLRLWELDPQELEASDNPFDWALYAGVCALQSGRKDRERVHYLKILNDKLDSKGWPHDKKLALHRFTDVLLRPKSLALRQEYEEHLRQKAAKEEKTMLSLFEESAEKRGEMKKTISFATKMLNAGEPTEKILFYTGISKKKLQELIRSRQND